MCVEATLIIYYKKETRVLVDLILFTSEENSYGCNQVMVMEMLILDKKCELKVNINCGINKIYNNIYSINPLEFMDNFFLRKIKYT